MGVVGMGAAGAAEWFAGQGWVQLGELALALLLSALIGLERESRQKSAGLRTHTLVGFASALIVIVSKYGFSDVLGENVALDPSRVAAQIVSGIGFIGGGLIFVRRDAVRGLTTAAVVWLTCAVGMAAGAGLWLLAVVVTAGHFLVTFGFRPLEARMARSRYSRARLRVTYLDQRGALRQVLSICTERGFVIAKLSLERHREGRDPHLISIWLVVQGSAPIGPLIAELVEVEGVRGVSSAEIEGSAV
ncbi:putative Mg(2+) transport ATPase [Nonomuraea coxensis DSM 45129]|uniref:Mg(2+) transport ATPase n=1 Tax=Nonomuraea coxensis DSM 45129 TaxID=1122611 RepID=A0ABX8U3X4_9ACTN|nr:MgtC/SapB family protein [Nonomuraea coxensis]QYC42318.1 putative Mg(2+) transport ATPase [Nonomuraea coxensis DSM 45129]